jgi:hypothetical protein
MLSITWRMCDPSRRLLAPLRDRCSGATDIERPLGQMHAAVVMHHGYGTGGPVLLRPIYWRPPRPRYGPVRSVA